MRPIELLAQISPTVRALRSLIEGECLYLEELATRVPGTAATDMRARASYLRKRLEAIPFEESTPEEEHHAPKP